MINRFFLFAFFSTCIFGFLHSDPLPGRKDNGEVYTARFGKSRLFFYMTPEKEAISKQFAKDVNQKMLHCITEAELDCPVNEITPVATTDPTPLGIDEEGRFIYVDQQGSEIFLSHSEKVKKLAEEALGINISALSQEMSLIINYDANKFHQDQCPVQYEYLMQHQPPIPRYTIFQDLTLINWEMADQTISGTILEDAESEDSFIMCFFNDEICCNVYTEPAIYEGPYIAPDYPGAATLAPHSPIPPIDCRASTTAGAGKGKRISVAVRGLVETPQIDELEERAINLSVDRPEETKNGAGLKDYSYKNDILLREVSCSVLSKMKMDRVARMTDVDEVEIFVSEAVENRGLVEALLNEFEISAPLSSLKVIHLYKRGEGFSYIPIESMGLEGEYTLLIINTSQIPENYRNYPIANDLTKQGIPWIQLYHFPPSRVMKVDSQTFNQLALSPIDEILFRDGIYDIHESHPDTILDKFYTSLHILAVPKNAEVQ